MIHPVHSLELQCAVIKEEEAILVIEDRLPEISTLRVQETAQNQSNQKLTRRRGHGSHPKNDQ